MDTKKIEKIMQLDREIDNISLQVTSYYEFKGEQQLNYYDKKIMRYYEEILQLMIEITKEENVKNIKQIDSKLKNWNNTASQMIESYISMLQFYRQFNKNIINEEINVLNEIKANLKLDYELEKNNVVELADCYFHIGDEEKAKSLMLEFIKNNPDEDEPYQCMQNWYIYDSPDINKLAEVIDLAEKNGHILITDFGYDILVKFFDSVGDINNKKKYQKFYDEWKKNRTTIEF